MNLGGQGKETAVQQQLQACLNELERIAQAAPSAARPVCAAGFDGFIDTLVSPVMKAGTHENRFRTIQQFGEYVAGKSGQSGAIELELKSRRAGGNAPIFSQALASLGVQVHCLAAMGFPEPDPIFAPIAAHCDAHSVAAPGLCTALEFEDGKIFLTQNDGIRSIEYGQIKARVGAERLAEIARGSSAIAMLNWGEIEAMQQVWQGALEDFSAQSDPAKRKTLLVDFADLSARSAAEIEAVLALLKRYRPWFDTQLSMNRNEFQILSGVLALAPTLDAASVQKMLQSLGVDGLAVHTPQRSFHASAAACERVENRYVGKPLISTGAGDHFNAGFMFGLLHRLDMQTALILAGAVSGYFVSRGCGPNPAQLADFIRQWQASC